MSALPVAANRELGAFARRVTRANRAELALVVAVQSLGSIAGLVAPWLLGDLVADVSAGHDTVAVTVLEILAALAAQAVLVRFATYATATFGEKILAGLREDLIRDQPAPGVVSGCRACSSGHRNHRDRTQAGQSSYRCRPRRLHDREDLFPGGDNSSYKYTKSSR